MKRTKRKNIKFSADEWKAVCGRAYRVKQKTGTFIRNLSLFGKWKIYSTDEILAPIRNLNAIGTSIDMVIRVAESTNSNHLAKLNEIRKSFEENRRRVYNRFETVMNTEN